MNEEEVSDKKPNICQLIQKAAAAAVAQEDVWAKHDIPSIPAERVIRHLYDPSTQSFRQEETIVKMQGAAFTHGAMRHCFRMKKLATPPQSAANHRFHSYGWSRASNYVAKAYMTADMTIDCSEEAKDCSYAIEFPNRPGSPWFAVERFIAGHDSYGASFVKHNTNSGFVDPNIRRTTPQVFSAFSFYKSEGRRLVADIQGVGDLYTDPQVLSADYRFGEGDLGPRGMALFFHSFRHCSFSDLMGIPIFPLSKNELKHQLKYDDDDETLSDDEQQDDDDQKDDDGARLQRMDLNRMRRKSVLLLPTDLPVDMAATAKRSNMATSKDVRALIRASIKLQHPTTLSRSKSDVDELSHSLISATMDAVFDHHAFHRMASGQVRERVSEQHRKESFRNDVEPAPPMMPTDETRSNLGKVHYQLARLHGMGRFPEMGQEPDVPTMVFHLSHACSLRNVSASVALGRLRAGLDSCVSDYLRGAVPIDFESAKLLFQRAMEVKNAPAKPRAAAGCLLLQILHEEEGTMDVTLMGVLEETLDLLAQAEKEEEQAKKSNERSAVKHSSTGFQVGDLVEANFALEGSFYPGVVTAVEGDNSITVKYDDDGSEETHTADNVRPMIHESTTSSAGGEDPLIDGENEDEQCLVEAYALKAELAVLKEKLGEAIEAADLFDEAADGAMNAGKMKSCSEWSTKAAELRATL